MQSVAVAVKRCLRHMHHLGCVPQAAAGSVHSALCSLHGFQTLPGHRLFLFFVFFCGLLLFPWLAILGLQMSVHRRVRPLLFSVGHFLVLCQVCRQLAAANVLAIGGCVCLCSRGAFSHIPPPPRASAGLELAFTQALRTLFFGPVRFPPSLGDSQHAAILSSAAFCCRCLPSVPWC